MLVHDVCVVPKMCVVPGLGVGTRCVYVGVGVCGCGWMSVGVGVGGCGWVGGWVCEYMWVSICGSRCGWLSLCVCVRPWSCGRVGQLKPGMQERCTGFASACHLHQPAKCGS